jgi:hypothetical protein
MRLDLIRPPRLGLLDPPLGLSAASCDIRIGPDVCAINVGCAMGVPSDPAVAEIFAGCHGAAKGLLPVTNRFESSSLDHDQEAGAEGYLNLSGDRARTTPQHQLITPSADQSARGAG